MDATSPKEDIAQARTTAPHSSGFDPRLAFAVAAVGVLVLFAIFFSTAKSFIPIWNTESFGHGYLIVPISGFLFWLCRHRIMRAPLRPSLVGLGLMIAVSAVWGLGEVADVNVVRQTAFVGLIPCLLLTLLGWPFIRVAIFPLGYLVFAIPFGEFLIPHLQDITAWFAVGALQLLGVPVYNDGIYIQTPTGSYLAAEACSGIRYLLSTLAISVLAAGMFFTSWHKRLIFVAAGIFVSILANAVRAAGVILLSHWVDPSLAGPIHITYGLVFVAVVTLAYLMVGASFKERTIDEYIADDSDVAGGSAFRPAAPLRAILAVGVIGLVCVGGTASYVKFALAHGDAVAAAAPQAPAARAPWEQMAPGSDTWKPHFSGAAATTLQNYQNGSNTVGLFIGLYPSQRDGAELINNSNRIENESWGRAGGGKVEVAYGEHRFTANYVRLLPERNLGNRTEATGRIVWYWHWVGGEYTASPLVAKFLEVKAILLGRSRAAAVIAIAADYADAQREASETLRSLLDHLDPLAPGLIRAVEPASPDPGS